MTPFIVHEYAHAVELHHEYFHGASPEGHFAPPTILHADKLRLFAKACPGGDGPHARLHYEYDATWLEPIPVGARIRTEGSVIGREVRKGRTFLLIEYELRSAEDGRVFVKYRDSALLAFKAGADFTAKGERK
jgi:hypothetical protein